MATRVKETNQALVYTKGGHTASSKVVIFTTSDDYSSVTKVKKFKLSYESGNAYENFTIEQYDGTKLEPIADLYDLGLKPNKSAYNLLDEKEHKERIEVIMVNAILYVKDLI